MQHWTNFWKYSKSLNSFSEGHASEGYQGELTELWSSAVESLPYEGSVLEIGCGNGALAALIKQISDRHNKAARIHATDLAEISPREVLKNKPELVNKLQGIDFHPSVNMESMPFLAESYNLIVGQFALEYSDIRKTLSEVFRVLKRGGRAVFMMHHIDSLITADSKAGSKLLFSLLYDSRVFDVALRHLQTAKEVLKSSDIQGWQQHSVFKETVGQLTKLLQDYRQQAQRTGVPGWEDDVFNRIFNVLSTVPRKDLDQSIDYLKYEFGVIEEHYSRIHEQSQSARSESQMESIEKHSEGLGFTTDFSPVVLNNSVFAWRLSVIKP